MESRRPESRALMRLGLAVAGAALALAAIAACGQEETSPAPVAATQIATSAKPSAYSPATITNCGQIVTYLEAPKRAVSLNQHATEVMLALGLQDRMVGTAYIDDVILPEFEAAYKQIPVLAKEYPSREVLLAAQPDFIFGGFASGFTRPENSPPRNELLQLGIHSYLSTASCPARTGTMNMDDIYSDFLNIGRIFGIEGRAQDLVATMQKDLTAVRQKLGPDHSRPLVFLYDSGDAAPFTAACCGAANLIIHEAGGRNIFDDLAGSYKTVSWEVVVQRDPEIVVLIEAEWSTSADKQKVLNESQSLSTIKAIRDKRFAVVPFSSTVPGPRVPAIIKELAKAFFPEKFPY